MNNSQMPILITDALIEVLATHKINPDDYKPAYDGESVGLDLYNAGPSITIPPLSDLTADYAVVGNTGWGVSTTAYTPKERQKVLIKTGLHLRVPLGWVALLRGRGSITKTPYLLRAGVIDPGYTGEVFVNLVNGTCESATIKHGDKLPIQIVVVRALTNYVNVSEEEFNTQHSDSKRGTGMVGSSDT